MKKKQIHAGAALLIAGILAGFLMGRISLPDESAPAGSGLTGATETAGPAAPGSGINPPPAQNASPSTAQESYLQPKIFETISGVSADDDPSVGLADAPLTIVEFSDYQCPFCKKHLEGAFAEIKRNYADTGKVRYVVRDFPVREHPQALSASKAAYCAGMQGKFWEMHDLLFAAQDEWVYQNGAADLFRQYAGRLGADQNTFDTCVAGDAAAVEIAKDLADGALYRVSLIPTIFVGDKKIVGAQPYEVFRKVIESELNTSWQTQET